ncbi:MAG: hypothetical protein M3Y59_26165 [Myxococcota bacterium]|nr:hypothetical protein [Myxococcota bacterium]
MGLKPVSDPQDTEADLLANPAHRIILGITNAMAKRLTKSAEILIRLPQVEIVGANGTVGVLPADIQDDEGAS